MILTPIAFSLAAAVALDGWLQTGALAAMLFFVIRWLLRRVDQRDRETFKERIALVEGLTKANEALARSVELAERDSVRSIAVHLELTRTQKDILRMIGELAAARSQSLEVQGTILEQIGELRRQLKNLDERVA